MSSNPFSGMAAKVVAIVNRAIHRIRRTTPYLRRYREPYRLPDAADRDPVLGSIGIGNGAKEDFVPELPCLYLESGLYDIASIVNDDPATWHVGDAIKGLPGGILGGWVPTKPPRGGVDPVFLPRQSLAVRDAAKKLCQVTAPASIYSGRLRAYVQALYGSDYVAYSLNGRNVQVNGQTFSAYGSGGTALYVHEITQTDPGDDTKTWNYNAYFILQVTTTQVSVYPLEMSDAAAQPCIDTYAKVLAAYRAEPVDSDLRPVYEGYLLALLQPADDPIETVSISIPEADGIPIGSPLYYGWQSTSDGHEISQAFVNYEQWTGHCRGQRVVLAVDYDDQQAPGSQWSVGVSVQGLVDGIPSRYQLGWLPDDDLGGSWLMFYPCTNSDPTNIPGASANFSGMQVGGWYDDADVWKPIVLSRTYNQSYSGGDVGTLSYSICGFDSDLATLYGYNGGTGLETASIGAGNKTYAFNIYGGYTQVHSLVTDIIKTGTWVDHINTRTQLGYSLCPGNSLPSEGGSGAVFCHTTSYGEKRQSRARAGNLTGSSTISFVIPRNNCRSAILLKDEVITSTNNVLEWYDERTTALENQGIDYQAPVIDLIYGTKSEDSVTVCDKDAGLLGADIKKIHDKVDLGSNHSTNVGSSQTTQAALVTGSALEVLGSKTTQGNIPSVPDTIISAHSGINPILTAIDIVRNGGQLSTDWVAFLTVPDAICTAGNRNLGLSPRVLESAIFGDAITPSAASVSAQIPDGGYEQSGESFIGWA